VSGRTDKGVKKSKDVCARTELSEFEVIFRNSVSGARSRYRNIFAPQVIEDLAAELRPVLGDRPALQNKQSVQDLISIGLVFFAESLRREFRASGDERWRRRGQKRPRARIEDLWADLSKDLLALQSRCKYLNLKGLTIEAPMWRYTHQAMKALIAIENIWLRFGSELKPLSFDVSGFGIPVFERISKRLGHIEATTVINLYRRRLVNAGVIEMETLKAWRESIRTRENRKLRKGSRARQLTAIPKSSSRGDINLPKGRLFP